MHHFRRERADHAPEHRRDLGEQASPRVPIERRRHSRTERLRLRVLVEPVGRLLNDPEGRFIARASGRAPGDGAVPAENQSLQVGVAAGDLAHLQSEVEPRTLPGNPRELAAEDARHQPLAVPRGGDGDERVGVHVIDVAVGDEGVEGRVDAAGPRIEIERTVRKLPRHLVFVLEAAIPRLQRAELVEIQRREALERRRSKVPARSLHPQHDVALAGERILLLDLGGRVSSTEVRDAAIRPEQIGSIHQELRLSETFRGRSVPPVEASAGRRGGHTAGVGQGITRTARVGFTSLPAIASEGCGPASGSHAGTFGSGVYLPFGCRRPTQNDAVPDLSPGDVVLYKTRHDEPHEPTRRPGGAVHELYLVKSLVHASEILWSFQHPGETLRLKTS